MINPTTILIVLIFYFCLLMFISKITSKKENNKSYFSAENKAPWIVVSIGMIGATISGASFLSVPGMVKYISFQYMQTCIGYFFGYIIIINVLLPIYYKLSSPSIYTYLEKRFGSKAYKTGAYLFLLSKSIGTAAKVYVIVTILQTILFDYIHIPFFISTTLIILMIWLYSHKGGLNTIVWTDMLQTVFMILSLFLIIYFFMKELNFSLSDTFNSIIRKEDFKILNFTDFKNQQNFFKQFFSGVFISLVMTGLDQDLIQKNRTIRSLKKAQRNMYWYGFSFIPLNLLFLTLGSLLFSYAYKHNIILPSSTDQLLPYFVSKNIFSPFISIIFIIGIISATFSTADSSLTALTTSYCIDIKRQENNIKLRKHIHFYITLLIILLILLFRWNNNKTLIDMILTIVGYTYGPLLGLFSFGILTKKRANDNIIPYIAILSPILSFVIKYVCKNSYDYSFGYELLLLNGLITFVGLLIFPKNKDNGDKKC